MASKKHKGSAPHQPSFNKDGTARAKYDENKHKRGAGGKFASKPGSGQPGPSVGGKKPGSAGSVGAAHSIFDKMKGQPKKEMLAAAAAAGINPNTAKTQLYHWQKKQAAAELAKMKPLDTPEATLQAAAAKAMGVPPAAPTGKPKVQELSEKLDAIIAGEGDVTSKAKAMSAEYAAYIKQKGPAKEVVEVNKTFMEKLDKLKGAKAPEPAKPPAPTVADGAYTKQHQADVQEILGGKGSYEKKLAGLNSTTITHIGLAKDKAAKDQIAKLHNESIQKLKQADWSEQINFGEEPDLAKLGPTKYVHALADSMPGAAKKDVIAEAVKAGVNKSTAGVQYGKWQKLKEGEPFQLKKSPEPKATFSKPADELSDKELDSAISAYHGKVSYKDPSQKFLPQPYKSDSSYSSNQGDKAMTAALMKGDVATQKNSGKTFYKDPAGNVYEHAKGAPFSEMKSLTGGTVSYWYEPNTKTIYMKAGGPPQPIKTRTPLFKEDQPYDNVGNHAFSEHPWVTTSGVQDPDVDIRSGGNLMEHAKKVHAAAGLTYIKNADSKALHSYTHSGYQKMNGTLRAKEGAINLDKDLGSTYAGYVRSIDDKISKSHFKEETIVWRGVGEPETTWNGAPPPDIVADYAFVSNSFNPQVAKGFSNGKTMFRVKVPKGFPGLNVSISGAASGVGSLSSEAEVMLPRGTTFRVVARHAAAAKKGKYGGNNPMDVVDLEPVLPEWYISKYGKPPGLA